MSALSSFSLFCFLFLAFVLCFLLPALLFLLSAFRFVLSISVLSFLLSAFCCLIFDLIFCPKRMLVSCLVCCAANDAFPSSCLLLCLFSTSFWFSLRVVGHSCLPYRPSCLARKCHADPGVTLQFKVFPESP